MLKKMATATKKLLVIQVLEGKHFFFADDIENQMPENLLESTDAASLFT